MEPNKCNCEDISCLEGCTKPHTHKGFWCEKCHPERYKDTTPQPEELKKECPMKGRMCQCSSKYCIHYKSDFDRFIENNPIINYYDEALRMGYATERMSQDKCWKRLYCIKDFRQERYEHFIQWKAGEPMELPEKTEYGIEMEEEKYKNYTRELASDLFKNL
jgi:hypothetical protein